MYNYETEKRKILTDEGGRNLMRVWDHVQKLLELSGAFKMDKAWKTIGSYYDSHQALAYVDRLVELNYIKEIEQGSCMGQDRIFVAARVN
jgi:hypothetical protein